MHEQDIKEQLGTSHAQGKEDPERVLPLGQDGSNGVALFPAISLPIPAGKEGEQHPPIRKVRGLTSPAQETEGEHSPQSESDGDPELELLLAQNRKTKRQLKDEVQSLTKKVALQEDTVKALKQHIGSQANSMASEKSEKGRLLAQCQKLAELVRLLPSGMVDEDMISKTAFTLASYKAAMYEHASWQVRSAREEQRRMEELEREGLEESDADKEDEEGVDKTPSPVSQGLELLEREGNVPPPTVSVQNPGLGQDQPSVIEEDKPQDHEDPLQSLKERQSMVPEATEGDSAKRDLSGSDDSDAGRSKPAQRMNEGRTRCGGTSQVCSLK